MLSGITVAAPFVHKGTARRLVHLAKYHASHAAIEVLADAMAGVVPGGTRVLVPIPRARLRRWRYGTDPAALLAGAVGRRLGIPTFGGLRAPVWWSKHAGAPARRSPPRFRSAGSLAEPYTLIDDVVTTGATAKAAVTATGIVPDAVVTATISHQNSLAPSDTLVVRESSHLWRYGR